MSRGVLLTIGAVLITATAFIFLGTEYGKELPVPHSIATSTPIATTSPMATTTKPVPSATKPAATSTSTPVAPSTAPQAGRAGWKAAIATVFWVGEEAGEENGFIHNKSSAWDVDWEIHFGGLDDPDNRCGFLPCGFTPKENPFYIALPYNDLDINGDRKPDARFIPWNDVTAEKSVLKNRWIEVYANGKSCYGQWEDVGPFGEDDVTYVFGTATAPKNTIGQKAGIDLSPALRDCLGVGGSSDVLWRHVQTSAVPAGPWKQIVTTRLSH